MKSSNSNQRRTVFTTDAKLAIRRAPAATMSASGQQAPDDEPKVTLEGYAMVWNTLSSDRGGFRVRLLPGSAKFTPEVFGLFHHDFRAILGATGNATLRIMPDDVGVKVEIDLPSTNTARDVAELVEDKYVRGMSFSMLYDPPIESATKNEGGLEILEVSSFTCDEVTVTAIPSFTDTTIGIQEGDTADDDDEGANTQEAKDPKDSPAYARIEQTHRLEQFRLAVLEI